MNAQEHYRQAEQLITPPDGTGRPREHDVALAQVHATLALAAAIAAGNNQPLDPTPAFPIAHH